MMNTFSTWRLFAELKFMDSHKKLYGILDKFCTELLQKLVSSPLDEDRCPLLPVYCFCAE